MLNSGLIYVLLAYFLWGFAPLFWKLIDYVPVDEVLGHRVVWSLATGWLLLVLKSKGGFLIQYWKNPQHLNLLLISSALIGANWFVFTYAVTQGYIVEASLGYFINPLLSVFLGVVFLKERPSSSQVFAILLAFIGVAYLTWTLGELPLISLSLALTFGLYGLVKKKVTYSPLEGMTLEASLMIVPALIFLGYLQSQQQLSFTQISLQTDLILAATGIVTLTPLICFAAAAQRLPLTAIGLFQYIDPTMQFLIGVFVYNEDFSQSKLIGFLFIWWALIVFTAEQVLKRFKKVQSPVSATSKSE